MKKVIIFGGSGFLGSHIADTLSEAGYEVRIFDIRPSKYLRPDQKMIIGDILDIDSVKNAIKGCDYVYNCGGIADLDDATIKPIDTIRLNIEGNVNILMAAREENIKRFIYASTIYVYSNKGGFYRCSKQAAEIYIEEFQRKYGLDFTILRFGTLYGLRANKSNSVYRYLYQALKEKRIKYNGTGEEMREYINVIDAAKLSVDILAETYCNKHIIITGHHPMRFKHLLEMIKEIMGKKVKLENEGISNNDHYFFTPYYFNPKIGQKLTSNCYIDMGQGLLECLREITGQIETEDLNN